MKRLKIGIVDYFWYALQARLLSEGHEILLLIPDGAGLAGLKNEQINATPVTKNIKITVMGSLTEMIAAKPDLVIAGSNHDTAYDVCTAAGIPTVGHSYATRLLENDRAHAHRLTAACNPLLKIPESHQFSRAAEAKEFLLASPKQWVMKQSGQSPLSRHANRTVVAHDPAQAVFLLDGPNAWFHAGGHGGVILEEYAPGEEISFGAWFDGENFNGPLYTLVEYKGAQNGGRGGVMTGEVGTTVQWHRDLPKTSPLWVMLEAMVPHLRGGCCGMFDINTIFNPITGTFTLIEYTVRFGRPTLELALAATPLNNWGHTLLNLANGSAAQCAWRYTADKIAAVVVYSYGHPLLNEAADGDVNEAAGFCPPNMPFQFPKTGKSGTTLPLFTMWRDGAWRVSYDNLQFVTIGWGKTWSAARETVYAPLADYHLMGCTWRDDIGLKTEAVYTALANHKIM